MKKHSQEKERTFCGSRKILLEYVCDDCLQTAKTKRNYMGHLEKDH